MEFRILGPLEVVDDGRTLHLGGGRQLALVAVLVLHANEAVSVDRLVEDLWGESPPPTAAKIVRNYVSLLRKELGDRLVTQAPGYLLRVEEGELDSETLKRAVESGDLDQLTSALARWRGEPLSQLAYEPFVQQEVARLEGLRLTALEARIEARLERGEHASLIPELEALVRQEPLREGLRAQLMLALYRSERQAEALAAYREARETLDRQLGIEPGPALRELERKILNQDGSLAAPAQAPEAPPARGRRRLSMLIAATVALALVAAIALLATRDSAGGLNEIGPNTVGVIDPETNEIVDAIPVGLRPGPIAFGAGAVWVGSLQDRNLSKIDPVARSTRPVVSLDERTPTGLAVGAGAVWVAHGLGGQLSRVEPQFGRVTQALEVTSRGYATPYGTAAVGAGHVWTAYGDSTLARIDPAAVRATGSALTGASPAAVAFGAGSIWIANAGDATVQRFDPITFQEGPIQTTNVGRRPTGIAYGEDAVWVAVEGEDGVTRIDPSTNSTTTVRVGDRPVAVAVGADAVWVANSGDGSVSRIDPATNTVVETIDVGSVPAGIAVGGGLVWVAAQAQ